MLIWSIFITIQSFTYFIALQFFSTQIKPWRWSYWFYFQDWLLDYYRSNYHRSKWINLCVIQFCFFFKGIQTKYNRLVALSVIVIYGGMVWYVFQVQRLLARSQFHGKDI
jgi:hypothetical protein